MSKPLVASEAPFVAAPPAAVPLWTPTFILLCAAIFVVAGHHAVLGPVVPLYIEGLGGTATITGIALVLFSIVSVVVRPWMGHWADRWSAVGVVVIGGLGLAAMALAHLVPVVWMVVLAGGLRGAGWAAANTGISTLLAHAAPPQRRGEASGYYNLFQNGAHGIFPAIGVWLVAAPAVGFNGIFLISASLGLSTAVVALAIGQARSRVPVSTPAPGPGHPEAHNFALYDKTVLLPAFLLMCVTLTHPASQSYLPLHAMARGITDIHWYFIALSVSSMVVLIYGGKFFDRVSRYVTLAIGFVLSIVGTVVLLAAYDVSALVLAGAITGVGQAIIIPNTMAIAIERANPERRGSAMSTYTAAYSTGQGVGAVIAGLLADMAGFPAMYVASVAAFLMGLAVTMAKRTEIRRRANS